MNDKPAVLGPPRTRLSRPPAPVAPDHIPVKPVIEGHLGFVDLNFKVKPKLHKRFRVEAAFAELSLKDLMIESFETWLKARGKALEEDER